jgi:hypothetical protein
MLTPGSNAYVNAQTSDVGKASTQDEPDSISIHAQTTRLILCLLTIFSISRIQKYSQSNTVGSTASFLRYIAGP